MSKELKVLTLQFEAAKNNKEKNFKTVAKLMRENADFEADLVILPELWNIGCDYTKFQSEAEYIPFQSTMLLSGLAEKYNTNIIGGSIIERTYDNKFYNTSLIINRKGSVIAQYRKNYTFSHCGSEESKYIEKDDNITVVELEGIKFGIGICYDIRFPELFREMLKHGAEIFVIPAAFPIERIEQWNILNQARALENLAILISCNQYGYSNVVSPYGKIIRTSNKGEKAIRNIINTDDVITARKATPFLNDIKY